MKCNLIDALNYSFRQSTCDCATRLNQEKRSYEVFFILFPGINCNRSNLGITCLMTMLINGKVYSDSHYLADDDH